MSRIKDTYNQSGTKVAEYGCETCGAVFTVCPAPSPEKDDQWRGCLAKGCKSYDPARDADKLFEDGNVNIRREQT
jgi:hypothetical protein